MAKKEITKLQENGGFVSGAKTGAGVGIVASAGWAAYTAVMTTHPFGLCCAATYTGLTAVTTVGGGLLNRRAEEAKIEKAEIALKKDISDFVKNILNDNVAQAQDINIWQALCASPKLPCLAKNDKDKIINNVPVVKQILQALVNNENMDNLLPEHYTTIKSKIEQLGGTEKNELLAKFENKFSVKTTQQLNALGKKVDDITKKIETEIMPYIKTLKENIDTVVKEANYNQEDIKVLKDLIGIFENKIDSIENSQEKLTELLVFQEILKPLAEIAQEPEFINSIKALNKGYKIDVDFNKQLKVLQKVLNEKLPDNDAAKERIINFARGYQGALKQVYELAPGFSSSVLSANAGKDAAKLKLFSTAFMGACNAIPYGNIGAVLIGGELSKMTENISADLINKFKLLGEVADGSTDPDNRADSEKKNVALQVINQHVLHMAIHLTEDPYKLEQLEIGKLKDNKKLKDYHKKLLNSFNKISQDIDIINGGEASFGTVSETLHEKILDINPIEEVACRMTASALTTSLPAFMQASKSKTEREATLCTVKYRNILKGNNLRYSNNYLNRPPSSGHNFGNI
jgi:hypothetical protein